MIDILFNFYYFKIFEKKIWIEIDEIVNYFLIYKYMNLYVYVYVKKGFGI